MSMHGSLSPDTTSASIVSVLCRRCSSALQKSNTLPRCGGPQQFGQRLRQLAVCDTVWMEIFEIWKTLKVWPIIMPDSNIPLGYVVWIHAILESTSGTEHLFLAIIEFIYDTFRFLGISSVFLMLLGFTPVIIVVFSNSSLSEIFFAVAKTLYNQIIRIGSDPRCAVTDS